MSSKRASELAKENRCWRCVLQANCSVRYAGKPMNIHEYQAKELLKKFDVATTHGKVAATLDEAEQIAGELGDVDMVVKAQIHAGGRGKGTFKNGFKGGVHVGMTPTEALELAAQVRG